MDPAVYTNIQWTLATLIYIKVIVTTCDYSLQKRWVPADITRKIIHVAACSWCLFWPKFDVSHWTWKLNVAIPFIYAIQLFIKGAILRDINDPDVKTMSRTGKANELLYGPFLFTLLMLYCGLYEFRQPTGTYIMGAMIGDGLAPLVGKHFPMVPYPTYGGDTKTVSGSTAMLFGSVLGILCYQWGLGVPEKVDLESIVLISLVATMAEACSGKWDNPAIAVSVYWFAKATDIKIQI